MQLRNFLYIFAKYFVYVKWGKALFALVCLAVAVSSFAQTTGLKTNLLYDATATFNVGAEVAIGHHYSVDVSGNYNPWTWKDNTKWKHWLVQPELRYWTCSPFAGHFFGLHAIVGQFNIGNIDIGLKIPGTDFSNLKDHRYQGWAAGAGVAYGYALPLARHWNIEFEIGAGAIYTKADSFECDVCSRPTAQNIKKLRPMLTKAAISIVYLF